MHDVILLCLQQETSERRGRRRWQCTVVKAH